MTLLPCTDCCLFLGVDPKTLRHWLQSANLSWTLHPRDARLKCLTPPQLQHLADLHGRFSPDPLPLATSTASPAEPPSARLSAADSDLRNLLTHLQTQVATLQEQVTQLALALLREREWHAQELLSHPAAPLPPSPTPSEPPRPSPAPFHPTRPNAPAPTPVPADPPSRSRSRALPLIEYGADGTYLAICPTQGILSLVPDSPEWFDWLSSLTAFTFQGANGRFSTTRKIPRGNELRLEMPIALFMATHALSIWA